MLFGDAVYQRGPSLTKYILCLSFVSSVCVCGCCVCNSHVLPISLKLKPKTRKTQSKLFPFFFPRFCLSFSEHFCLHRYTFDLLFCNKRIPHTTFTTSTEDPFVFHYYYYYQWIIEIIKYSVICTWQSFVRYFWFARFSPKHFSFWPPFSSTLSFFLPNEYYRNRNGNLAQNIFHSNRITFYYYITTHITMGRICL